MLKWNPITDNTSLPKKSGTYMITVVSSESDTTYRESRTTHCTQFSVSKSGYFWEWDDSDGTNTFDNFCEMAWDYAEDSDNTKYCVRIVAWAEMPEPYKES